MEPQERERKVWREEVEEVEEERKRRKEKASLFVLSKLELTFARGWP